MKKVIKVNVEGYGKIRLENQGDYYTAEDENGNFLGDVYPDEIDGWSEDETILSSIMEELIDDGTLEIPTFDADFCGDFED